jgi:hypothetical protein
VTKKLIIPKVFVLLQIIWKQLSLKTIYLKLGHFFERDMKNKSHPLGGFKWSSIDQALLPALSGVVKTNVLTLQR